MEIEKAEQFDTVVRKIFAKLLENFPASIPLDASDIGIKDDLPVETAKTLGGLGVMQSYEIGPQEIFFDQCIEWLTSEGYITATAKSFGSFGRVRLTYQGLEVLNAVPQCLISDFND